MIPAIIGLLFFSHKASAQLGDRVRLEYDNTYFESMYFEADTMTVNEAFEFLDLLASGRLWYVNRYVTKNDTTYLRYGVTLNKNRTFRIEGNKKRRIKRPKSTNQGDTITAL